MFYTKLPIDWRQAFARRLRATRLEMGLSQRGLAASLDIESATVQQWESGRASPTVYMLLKFAPLFDLHWLLTGEVSNPEIRERFESPLPLSVTWSNPTDG